MSSLAKPIVVAGLALVLAAVNLNIRAKQQIVDSGQRILLELRPVDPRSLMQGDFRRLRYAERVFPDEATRVSLPRRGVLVLGLDQLGVATYVRIDDGASLADREVRLEYKLNPEFGDLRLGAETFFFEEGQAERYDEAEYGVLAVDENGTSVLIGLADEAGQLIVPAR